MVANSNVSRYRGSDIDKGRYALQRRALCVFLLALLIDGSVSALSEVVTADDLENDCAKYLAASGSGSGEWLNDDDEDARVTRCEAGAENCDDDSDSDLYRKCYEEYLKGKPRIAGWAGDPNDPYRLSGSSPRTPLTTSQTASSVQEGYKNTWDNPAVVAAVSLAGFVVFLTAVLVVLVGGRWRWYQRGYLLRDNVYV